MSNRIVKLIVKFSYLFARRVPTLIIIIKNNYYQACVPVCMVNIAHVRVCSARYSVALLRSATSY